MEEAVLYFERNLWAERNGWGGSCIAGLPVSRDGVHQEAADLSDIPFKFPELLVNLKQEVQLEWFEDELKFGGMEVDAASEDVDITLGAPVPDDIVNEAGFVSAEAILIF